MGPSKTPTIVERHVARVEWARENVAAILEWLGISPTGGWRVRGLLVTDDALATRYTAVSKLPFPIVAAHDVARDDFDETRV